MKQDKFSLIDTILAIVVVFVSIEIAYRIAAFAGWDLRSLPSLLCQIVLVALSLYLLSKIRRR